MTERRVMGMAADREQLQEILDQTLQNVELPQDCVIVAEGSLAEGFGNSRSDIDFLAIAESDQEFLTIPTVMFVGGRRVEVRVRSAENMLGQISKLLKAARLGPDAIRRIDEEDLDRCQRFVNALPLRRPDRFVQLLDCAPKRELTQVIAKWAALQAFDGLLKVGALQALQQYQESASWARTALAFGVKAILAEAGETYLAKKWISLQLDRANIDGTLKRRIAELESPVRCKLGEAEYVQAVAGLLKELKVCPIDIDHRKFVLRRKRGVTTWEIGTRVHVLDRDQNVFAFNASGGRAWRSLRFNTGLPEVTANLAIERQAIGAFVSDCLRHGLIELHYKGIGCIVAPKPTGLIPTTIAPLMSMNGINFEKEEAEPKIRLAPISGRRFAAAGMELVYANMVVENALEDAQGALVAEQWGVFERSIRRMLRFACKTLLAAFGIHPLPAVEELPRFVGLLEAAPSDLRTRIVELDRSLAVDCAEAALSALEQINQVVVGIREVTLSSIFPSSFVSAIEWQKTLGIGYDWARLGAYLDAKFPLDQARDLIAAGGCQPSSEENSCSVSKHQAEN